jgi:hypothetical protein
MCFFVALCRLADLLAREQQQYLEELAALQPTSDQRRIEMETRARQYVETLS